MAANHPDILKTPHKEPIIKIIEKNNFNACATVINQQPIFLFNGAIHLILHDIFHRILARSDFFQEIGDNKLEILEEATLQNYCYDTDLLVSSTIPYKHPNAQEINGYFCLNPICKTRSSFATFLTHLAWLFIYEHESTHYLNGHVEFLKDKGHIPFIEELKVHSGEENKDYVLFQTLEMDADCIALNRCINACYSTHKALIQKKASPSDYPFHLDIYKIIYYQLFAINTAFIIFFLQDLYYQGSYANPEKFIHPPPNLRMQYLSGVIVQHTKKFIPELNSEKIIEISEQAFIDAVKAYHQTTANSAFKEIDNVLTLNKPYLEHFSKLNKCWKEIRDPLQKFAYKKLAPADT